MGKVFISVLLMIVVAVPDIYSFVLRSADNTEIRLENYRGKKLLIVNIATESNFVQQLTELQHLYIQNAGRLEILACPSNSFGNEPLTDSAISAFCKVGYGTTFPIMASGDVKGVSIQPLYYWLTRFDQNNSLNSSVNGDFQKYLIDENGELQGVFTSSTSPLSEELINAIQNTVN